MNCYLLPTLLFLFLLSALPAEATRVMELHIIDESTLKKRGTERLTQTLRSLTHTIKAI